MLPCASTGSGRALGGISDLGQVLAMLNMLWSKLLYPLDKLSIHGYWKDYQYMVIG